MRHSSGLLSADSELDPLDLVTFPASLVVGRLLSIEHRALIRESCEDST